MTPVRVSEAELDRRFQTKTKLASRGNYGLHCLVFEGALSSPRPLWFDDSHFYELCGEHEDVGTILIDGDVRCSRMLVSDRLICLVITGDLVVDKLSIFETEVCVFGNVQVGELKDTDDYLTVHGSSQIGRRLGYGDDPA